jgi:hypothetical protein
MGRRGREIVVNEFSLDRVIEANLTLYRSLLASLPGLESVVTALAVGNAIEVGQILTAPDSIGNGGVSIPGASIDI